jgi:sulfatase maturation enzyme AslB (radical SAM superfamily)
MGTPFPPLEPAVTNDGPRREIFALPVGDRWLVYAPLHRRAGLLPEAGLSALKRFLADGTASEALPLTFGNLREGTAPAPPGPRTGALDNPLYLGLITTRRCNLECAYCDFAAGRSDPTSMSVATARQAIDAYFAMLADSARTGAQIHFFGGEPFVARRVVRFAVEHARPEDPGHNQRRVQRHVCPVGRPEP